MRAGFDHLPLSKLVGEQDPPANLEGVFDGFEAGRERLPLFVAEIGVRGAGGEDEIVVAEVSAAGKPHLPRSPIDVDDFVHEHFGVPLVAQDGANRLSDIGRRQHRKRDLVEQGLK